MLPPFRIRNLRESSRLADTNDHGGHSTELGAQDQHGIVQVSAPEYDATISTHPEATLKYMDEDDGEVITVRIYLPRSRPLLTRPQGWFIARIGSTSRRTHHTGVKIFDQIAALPLPRNASSCKPSPVNYKSSVAHFRHRSNERRFVLMEYYRTEGEKGILFPDIYDSST